jgi:hypothetical protein
MPNRQPLPPSRQPDFHLNDRKLITTAQLHQSPAVSSLSLSLSVAYCSAVQCCTWIPHSHQLFRSRAAERLITSLRASDRHMQFGLTPGLTKANARSVLLSLLSEVVVQNELFSHKYQRPGKRLSSYIWQSCLHGASNQIITTRRTISNFYTIWVDLCSHISGETVKVAGVAAGFGLIPK